MPGFSVFFGRLFHSKQHGWFVFCLLWLVAFIMYLPAAEAGKCGSYYREWLEVIQNHDLKYFLQPPSLHSLYQFTQLFTWLFYQVFGAGLWPWHLLALTLHVFNCTLIYLLFRRLVEWSGSRKAVQIALSVAFIFCTSAYNTEVIVHEPCYHYTQGLLFMLLILFWLTSYAQTLSPRYAWGAAIIFLCATYSIEMFYLVPFFVLFLALYIHATAHPNRGLLRRISFMFLLPELILFVFHRLQLKVLLKQTTGHGLDLSLADTVETYLTRLPGYLFHVLLLGRYFPEEVRKVVYHLSATNYMHVALVLLLGAYYSIALIRLRKLTAKGKLIAFAVTCGLLAIGLVSVLRYQDSQLVQYDRYLYCVMPFMYFAAVLWITGVVNRYFAAGIVVVFCIFNMYFACYAIDLWHQSAQLISSLIHRFPDPRGRTVLLLNPPENMQGVEMIGSDDPSFFKLAYNLETNRKIGEPVYDVVSYNIVSVKDGVHARVMSDSVVRVTLNQWATWWWYGGLGGHDYQNEQYKLAMQEGGSYLLTLKHPAAGYMLVFQTGDQWKEMDFSKRDEDQW